AATRDETAARRGAGGREVTRRRHEVAAWSREVTGWRRGTSSTGHGDRLRRLLAGMDICEGSTAKNVEMLCGMESKLQGYDGGGHSPMVQLLGGSACDPLGNWRLKKKTKLTTNGLKYKP
ncbi:unnamed protein product, partial [Urochloa humidicola]